MRNYCIETYTFIFFLFSSDTLQELMFVCPTVSDLRFYGCCHLCFSRFECVGWSWEESACTVVKMRRIYSDLTISKPYFC